MKKKILSLALVAMSFVTFSSMAQNTADATGAARNKKENVCTNPADCKQKRACVNPFEGINLTEAQQTKLQELSARQKAAREESAKARKDNKQRIDSTRMADRRASRKSYLQEVKEIIGHDQYVVFLENFYVNGGNNTRKASFSKMKSDKARASKGDRNGRKGNRHGDRHASARGTKTANAAQANS